MGAKQKLKVLINVFQILVITQEVNFDGGWKGKSQFVMITFYNALQILIVAD